MRIVDTALRFTNWRYWILVLSLRGLVLFSGTSLATNHYVWCGATGSANGTEFRDAYTDLPATLVRGDTYYIAGSDSCSYRAHTFNDPLKGTTVISILHATSATNSGVTGWQSSFGTAIASWPTGMLYGRTGHTAIWVIYEGYYVFDGEFGSVGTVEPTTNTFGFHLRNTGDGAVAICVDGTVNSEAIPSLKFNHTEFDGSPMSIANVVNGAEAFFAKNAAGLSSFSNVSFYEDYFHDWETGFYQLNSPSNLTIDHSWHARVMYTASTHGNGVAINPGGASESASNLVFSNDTWEDTCGTSVITAMNGRISDIVVYGNTFFQNTTTIIFPGTTNPVGCNGDGEIGDLGNTGEPGVNGAKIYNNTFYNNTTTGRTGIDFTNPNATNIIQMNNLFVNAQNLNLTTRGSGDVEAYNTVINYAPASGWSCKGTGDSCQGTNKTVTSATITTNVADVVISSGHGLRLGSPVVLFGSQADGNASCGINTYYPYPTVSKVVSSTEFQYAVQQKVPNAVCQGGYGELFASPIDVPFAIGARPSFASFNPTPGQHLYGGIALPAPYNVDPNGNLRGTDGHWDRGAYQFIGSGVPIPPTNLTVVVK